MRSNEKEKHKHNKSDATVATLSSALKSTTMEELHKAKKAVGRQRRVGRGVSREKIETINTIVKMLNEKYRCNINFTIEG